MNYVSYEKAIVVTYGVELLGYTLDKLENPGNIRAAADLNALLSALAQGVCYWRTLSADEWKARREAYALLEIAGAVKKRKLRSDVGKTKNPHRTATGKIIQQPDQAGPRKKQKTTKSAEVVQPDSEEEQDDEAGGDEEQDDEAGDDEEQDDEAGDDEDDGEGEDGSEEEVEDKE